MKSMIISTIIDQILTGDICNTVNIVPVRLQCIAGER